MGNCLRRILHCFSWFQSSEPSEKKPLLEHDDLEEDDIGSSVDSPYISPPSITAPSNEINVPVEVEACASSSNSLEDVRDGPSLLKEHDERFTPSPSNEINVPVEVEACASSSSSLEPNSLEDVPDGPSLLKEHDERFTPFGEEWDRLILARTQSAKVRSPIPSPKHIYQRQASESDILQERSVEEKQEEKKAEDETDSLIVIPPTKRQLTAMELLQTETTYIRNLKIIIEIYKQPLEKALKAGEPILAAEDIRDVFGGVSDILNVHSEMHEELSAVISDWQEDCCIAEIITKYQSQLTKAYPPYVNYFDMGKDVILKQKKSNAKFAEFLTNCFNNPTCLKQPLDALLIRPVQRLPSMSLLINDLQRRTPEEIGDHAELEKAKEALKQVLSHINEDKRKTEGKMKIFDIIYEVESCPIEIVSANRLFVTRINALSLNEGLYRPGDRLCLYLLTDMIVVTKFKRSPGNVLLKYIKTLPLSDIKLVVDIADSDESQNMFAVQLTDEPSPNIIGSSYDDHNMDKFCVCQALDDKIYKDDFLKKVEKQMRVSKDKISDDPILKKLEPSVVKPMLKRDGSRVFRRGRAKPKRD